MRTEVKKNQGEHRAGSIFSAAISYCSLAATSDQKRLVPSIFKMSIFSKKKKAAEQERKAEAEANKPKPAPYFHTPTHAARDFLSSTPPSYIGQHRAQIVEQQNNRNSLMTRTMGERAGKASTSGASTPIHRSSSQISTSSSIMADYPPVVTVQRKRPNPFLSASAQQNFETVDEVPPMPAIPHRYSSPAVPKVENKTTPQQRPFSTSQRATYVRSPLSTSSKYDVTSHRYRSSADSR